MDVAVVGAGCIGASTALHLARRGLNVTVFEKESQPAMHQSGRNSGVIHAGYNLKPGSAKARFCVEGSRQMRAYCKDRGVAMDENGILVLAQPGREARVDQLLRQGRQNGVAVDAVEAAEIRRIEPEAGGAYGLHAPEAASVDARGFVAALVADAEAEGARFRYGANVKLDDLDSPVKVNAAGLQADRLLETDYRIIPFRGSYHTLTPSAPQVRGHVYSAPDPDFPFLGVHVSRRVDGTITAGPGASIALGREAYAAFGVSKDLASTLSWPGLWRLIATPQFRHLARREAAKAFSTRAVWKEARALLPGLKANQVRRGGSKLRGHRAQLVDREGRLVDDMVVHQTEDTVHVLNAVSPGLTCSLPFGKHIAGLAEALL